MTTTDRFAAALALASGLPADAFTFFYKGRVALYSILKAADIGRGDEVIIPAYTCVVVPNAILYLGAKPRYLDINLKNFSMNTEEIKANIRPSTKAVIAQNTYGLSSGVDDIASLCKSYGVLSVEDCTHGFSGTYHGKANGSWCDAAFYSSQWNKPFCSGIGGYAVAQEDGLANRIREISDSLPKPSMKTSLLLWALIKARSIVFQSMYYSLVKAYRFLSVRNIVPGSSSGEELSGIVMPPDYLQGMSPVQMQAGLRQLRRLADMNKRRKAIADRYTAHLSKLGLNHVAQELAVNHLFLKYPLLVFDRPAFQMLARKSQIPLGEWFVSPLHPVQGDLRPWAFDATQYPNAVFAASHIVNLPTDISNSSIDRVLDFIDRNSSLIMPDFGSRKE